MTLGKIGLRWSMLLGVLVDRAVTDAKGLYHTENLWEGEDRRCLVVAETAPVGQAWERDSEENLPRALLIEIRSQ